MAPYAGYVLDRPGRRNTIDDSMLSALDRALTAAESSSDNRVFVISATGEDFCAGMDLDTAPPAGPVTGELPYWKLLRRLTTSPLVTVSVVDGAATAGGVGLAAACDVVLAGRGARFRLTETLLGLVPAMALPFVVRRTGEQRAFTAALLADDIDAEAALGLGLVDRVGASGQELLRPLLVGLRRVQRETVAALKNYRNTAFGWRDDLGTVAGQAFLDRLDSDLVRTMMKAVAS
jgi:polyketide biosynthesis enoyl-CoA hydratase PksH